MTFGLPVSFMLVCESSYLPARLPASNALADSAHGSIRNCSPDLGPFRRAFPSVISVCPSFAGLLGRDLRCSVRKENMYCQGAGLRCLENVVAAPVCGPHCSRATLTAPSFNVTANMPEQAVTKHAQTLQDVNSVSGLLSTGRACWSV